MIIPRASQLIPAPLGTAAAGTSGQFSDAGHVHSDTPAKLGVSGITGATAVTSRYVGAVNGGAPTTGTFLAGDYVVDLSGGFWVCITGGPAGGGAVWTFVGQLLETVLAPKPLGTAAVGANGKAADSGHIHSNDATDLLVGGKSLPRGRIASAAVTTDTTVSAVTEVDVIGASGSFTLTAANRRLKVTVAVPAYSTGASDEIVIRGYIDTTVVTQAFGTVSATVNRSQPFVAINQIVNLSAASHTFKVTVARNTGAGVVHVQNTAGQVGILIEDMGV